MREKAIRAAIAIQVLKMWTIDKVKEERGEGVISVAIAVLIMAALGALVWVGFQTFWTTTEGKTNDKLNQIG